MRNRIERLFAYEIMVIGSHNRWTCHYCGMPGDTLDHIPPTSKYQEAVFMGVEFKPIRVPACRECNMLAGDAFHIDFLERWKYVKGRLEKKYRKQLRVVEWDPEELAELGPILRDTITKNMHARSFCESRMGFFPMEEDFE